jgi:hypothetical protein
LAAWPLSDPTGLRSVHEALLHDLTHRIRSVFGPATGAGRAIRWHVLGSRRLQTARERTAYIQKKINHTSRFSPTLRGYKHGPLVGENNAGKETDPSILRRSVLHTHRKPRAISCPAGIRSVAPPPPLRSPCRGVPISTALFPRTPPRVHAPIPNTRHGRY